MTPPTFIVSRRNFTRRHTFALNGVCRKAFATYRKGCAVKTNSLPQQGRRWYQLSNRDRNIWDTMKSYLHQSWASRPPWPGPLVTIASPWSFNTKPAWKLKLRQVFSARCTQALEIQWVMLGLRFLFQAQKAPLQHHRSFSSINTSEAAHEKSKPRLRCA